MADKLKVAWFNGLNIDKIHFEQQERYFERNINLKTISIFNNLHGIIDLEFSNEMLMQGKIALKRISGIAKDGSIFNAPEQDDLPEPLEINYDSLANSIIVVKIPMGLSSIADISLHNNIPNSKYISLRSVVASRIYDDSTNDALKHIDLEDEFEDDNVTFSQEKMNITLASLRLKLGFLGSKTPDELEIPIAKIKSIDLNKKIDLDENFIPTCLDLSKSSYIRSFLEEISHSIKQHKEVLSEVFKGIDQTKNTLDFSTYLSLNLLKKWHLIFSYIINKDKIHPEILYEKLIDFQGDLNAFCTENSFTDFIAYNHDNLTNTFLPLTNQLRILFAKITSPKYTMAQVIDNGNGFYDLLFDNPTIIEEAELFLAVNADVNHEYLLYNFKTQSKIYTQSRIKNIVATQLRGINIEQISNIPSSIPYLNGYIYYKIDKKDEIFQHFKNESVVSLYLTTNIKNPDIKMWAVF
ncbi:type VI secretion system baseplate subunit TssK [Campylobacter sp. 2014D-0216]|uniref:type VI secretion system baseplate subunit TssK n=1 Tax=Campylobacter sp. 2014D-0216 TaxID=1813595 RepID=UPI0018A66B22|nr:type VI secretion system baseplate subunit TssK [Campylobacter sp. 2014D-0216]QOR00544.1 type VI secretion system baseplate subunit TssK [Campylobacter sp. 2014D-0216]